MRQQKMTSVTPAGDELAFCSAKLLPYDGDGEDIMTAAARAIEIYPGNAPQVPLFSYVGMGLMEPEHLAVLTSKYWGPNGVKLTTAFMEQTSVEDRNEILRHLNAWGQYCNVEFVYSTQNPQVRISRGQGGYWSYLGTDILGIPSNQPTMNLQGITARTAESEKRRVIRHEAGHTLGFPHEHTRKQIVDRIDVNKAIQYFQQTQGWSRQTVIQQVLTPLEEASIMGTSSAEETSIMTYQLPGSIMKNGQGVPGGNDISQNDATFANKLYPKTIVIPPVNPPVDPPTENGGPWSLKNKTVIIDGKTYTAEWKLSLNQPSLTISQGEIEEKDDDEEKQHDC